MRLVINLRPLNKCLTKQHFKIDMMKTVQGKWSMKETNQHINSLELEAVIQSVKHFLPQLRGKRFLIRSGNTTVDKYINKQGVGRDLWIYVRKLGICDNWWSSTVKGGQISGREKHTSGSTFTSSDKRDRLVHSIFQILGFPSIDLFASIHNNKLQVFCSWSVHHLAYAIDALSIKCAEHVCVYLPANMLDTQSAISCSEVPMSPYYDSPAVVTTIMVSTNTRTSQRKSKSASQIRKSSASTQKQELIIKI